MREVLLILLFLNIYSFKLKILSKRCTFNRVNDIFSLRMNSDDENQNTLNNVPKSSISRIVNDYIQDKNENESDLNAEEELLNLFEENPTIKKEFKNKNKNTQKTLNRNQEEEVKSLEPMFSQSYDPLENPTQQTIERDLEDMLMDRSLRFFDTKNNKYSVSMSELCYLVGLEDKSSIEYKESIKSKNIINNNNENNSQTTQSSSSSSSSSSGSGSNNSNRFTLEESLTELSELAGAAGLSVCGSSYQRVDRPSLEYYIGSGKVKDIRTNMDKLKCCTVIFDTELSPSQQKNLEMSFNQDRNWRKGDTTIKVVDRTALILDIFAQHARTREGKLQVQLALLTYRLPRLTNMWTHLERQSAGARGKSNGGVGLRGPGETQLETDKRQMRSKISALKKTIELVRKNRALTRERRRKLGVPVIALVGYTNSGKSSLLNALAPKRNGAPIFTADMLFATLDNLT